MTQLTIFTQTQTAEARELAEEMGTNKISFEEYHLELLDVFEAAKL